MHAFVFVLTVLAADPCDQSKLADAVVSIAVEKDKRTHIERAFVGPGIALADSLVLVPVTVFRDGVPQKVYVNGALSRVASVDNVRGLILLKTPTPASRPATVAPASERPTDGSHVHATGYADTRSEPRLFEKRVLDGKVTRSRFGGASPDGLDLGDLMAVQVPSDDRLVKQGAAIFSKKSCGLVGLSIGELRGGDLMVIPSETILTFLRSPRTRPSD